MHRLSKCGQKIKEHSNDSAAGTPLPSSILSVDAPTFRMFVGRMSE